MEKSGMRVSIISPAFNEAEGVETCLQYVTSHFDRFLQKGLIQDYQIVLVDDASTDNTRNIAKEVARTNPRVKPVCRDQNGGIGLAINSGIKAADFEYVLVVPADNQLDLDFGIAEMLEKGRSFDIVLGRRKVRRDATIAKILSVISKLFVKGLLGIELHDSGGFDLMRTSIFNGFDISSKTFHHAEILIMAEKRSLLVGDSPIQINPRTYGEPKYRSFRALALCFKDLLVLTCQTRLRSSSYWVSSGGTQYA